MLWLIYKIPTSWSYCVVYVPSMRNRTIFLISSPLGCVLIWCRVQASYWLVGEIYKTAFSECFRNACALSHVLIMPGVWETSALACSQRLKIKWLICSECSVSTQDAGMHVGQLGHVCSCVLKDACQVGRCGRQVTICHVPACLMGYLCCRQVSKICKMK